MASGGVLNPVDEFVQNLRRMVKDNNGFCLDCEQHNSKHDKCPKRCGKDPDKCTCGMYVSDEYFKDGDD